MGRPLKDPEGGKRHNAMFRMNEALRARLMAAAEGEGCSMSEEIERRLEASFRAEDTRQIVREEIRAALSESARIVAPHAHTFRADFERRLSGSDIPLTGPEREAFLDGMEAVDLPERV